MECSGLLGRHFNDPACEKIYDLHVNGQLTKILFGILKARDDKECASLCIASASLLFDIHNRENLLFCHALSSYLYTDKTKQKADQLLRFDEKRLLVKTHQGKLSEDERQEVLDELSDIANDCLLKGDPAEPHTCFQGIMCSTGKYNSLFMSRYDGSGYYVTCDPELVFDS